MADLAQQLVAIRTGVYGNEIRDAIYDSLLFMNEDINAILEELGIAAARQLFVISGTATNNSNEYESASSSETYLFTEGHQYQIRIQVVTFTKGTIKSNDVESELDVRVGAQFGIVTSLGDPDDIMEYFGNGKTYTFTYKASSKNERISVEFNPAKGSTYEFWITVTDLSA